MMFDNWAGLGRTLMVGTFAYLGLVVMLRASGKRTLSKMNAFDLVVTVAIGSTLAATLLNQDVALAEGLLAMALLVGLQFAITWLSVRSQAVSEFVKSEPSLLYHQGRYMERELKRMRVTRSEVQAAVRQTGKLSIEAVDAVVLETDGTFSVLSAADDVSRVRTPIGMPES
jgi:uncharacterized membrane protein YcaP (DUF421 family)